MTTIRRIPQFAVFNTSELVLHIRATCLLTIRGIPKVENALCHKEEERVLSADVNGTTKFCSNETHSCNLSQVCVLSIDVCKTPIDNVKSDDRNSNGSVINANHTICEKTLSCNETETCVEKQDVYENRATCSQTAYASVLYCSTENHKNASLWLHKTYTSCSRPCTVRCVCSISQGKIITNCSTNNVSLTLLVYPNVTKIGHLYLGNSGLRFVDESTFIDHVNLQVLDLSSNELVSINSDSLQPLANLSRLILKDNKLSTLSNVTHGLPELVVLDLSNNSLQQLSVGDLSQLKRLEHLNLFGNKLLTLQSGVFQGIQNLTKLILSHNSLIEIEAHAFDHTFSSDCNVKFLVCEIDLSYNGLPMIHRKTFQRVTRNRLKNINKIILSHNKLTSLQPRTFHSIHYLTTLDLSYNYLTTLEAGVFEAAFHGGCNELFFTGIICTLDISHNNINTLTPYSFGTINRFTRFNVSYNELSTIPPYSFDGLDYVFFLDLSHNHIINIEEDSFQGLDYLHELDLSHNYLNKVPAFTFDGTLSLGCSIFICTLDLSFNQLQGIEPDAFDGLWHLGILNVSNNNLPTLDHDALNGLSMFCTIDTSNNSPGNQTDINWLNVCNGFIFVRVPSNHVKIDETDDELHELCKLDIRVSTTGLVKENFELQLEILGRDEQDLQYLFVEYEEDSSKSMCKRIVSFPADADDCRVVFDTVDMILHSSYTKTTLVVTEIERNVSTHSKCPCGNSCTYDSSLLPQRCETLHHQSVMHCQSMEYQQMDVHFPTGIQQYEFYSCATPCSSECSCSIGVTEIISECKSGNTTSTLIIYPSFDEQRVGISFSNGSIKSIRENVFKSFSSLLVLDFTNNGLEVIESGSFIDLLALKYLSLAHNKLSQLNYDMLRGLFEVTFMDLSHNAISMIVKGTFLDLPMLQTLDLSFNLLSTVRLTDLDELEELQSLNLSNNNISSIRFGNQPKLLHLYLTYNQLTSLEQNVFENLTMLETLDLTGNILITLYPGCFKGLRNLQVLLWQISITEFKTNMFSGLGNIVTFNFSHHNVKVIEGGAFNGLSKLKTLILDNNELKEIVTDTFKGLPSLLQLSLKYNFLTKLHQNTFDGASSLRSLNMSGNILTYIEPKSFLGVNNLVELSWQLNISIIMKDMLKGLRNIQTLDFDNHGLVTLETGAFNGLTGLKSLTLKGNQLSELESGIFSDLHRLRVIDLRNNRLAQIDKDVFQGLQSVQNLDLSNQYLTHLEEQVFDGLSTLKFLNLSNNSLSTVKANTFATLETLEVLDLEDNMITMLEALAFNDLSNLQKIYLKKNNVSRVETGAFSGLTGLVDLDLYNHSIQLIPSDLFENMARLWLLNLGSNIINEIQPSGFQGLSNLTVLDLHANRLTVLVRNVFNGLKNLRILYLQDNKIAKISGKAFVPISALDMVNLSGNSLNNIVANSFKGLPVIADIYMDDFMTCCFVLHASCHSPKTNHSVFLSCQRILPSGGTRFYIWLFTLCAFTGNAVLSYWVFIHTSGNNKGHLMLIYNLILANFLMALYMLVLVSADSHYGDSFPIHSERWRNSFNCHAANFLFIIANKASVFAITLISIERYVGLRLSFNERILSLKDTIKLLLGTWTATFVIGAIPVLVSTVGNLDLSEKCIALPLARELTALRSFNEIGKSGSDYIDMKEIQGPTPGMYYSIVTFVGIDVACLIVIIFTYIHSFISVDARVFHQCDVQEVKSTYRQAVVALANGTCWMAVIVIIISFQMSSDSVAPPRLDTILICVLSINSYINPLLYIIATILLDRWQDDGTDTTLVVSLDSVGESAL